MGTYMGRGFGGMGGGVDSKGPHREGGGDPDPDPDPSSPSLPEDDPLQDLDRSPLKRHHNPDPGP